MITVIAICVIINFVFLFSAWYTVRWNECYFYSFSPACHKDLYDCDDFWIKSQREAQYVYDSCYPFYGDVHHLDADNDGIACENLNELPERL